METKKRKIFDSKEFRLTFFALYLLYRCNAVSDSTLSLTIDWYSNGQPIEFEMEPRFVRSTDYSLMITKTIELDSGIYTCVARTELDEARAQATLIVQDVPNAPSLIEVKCGSREARVKWMPMGDNRAPILRFTIQSNTSFTPDTWEISKDNVPATALEEAVLMSPWANYTFRVLAWNKIGKIGGLQKSKSHSVRKKVLLGITYEADDTSDQFHVD